MTLSSDAAAQGRKRWILVLTMMWVPFLMSFAYSYLLEGTRIGNSCYIAVKFYLLAGPTIATVWILRERVLAPIPDKLRLRIRSIIMGTIFAVLTVGVMFGLMQTGIGDVVRDNGHQVKDFTIKLGVLEHFWMFAIFLSFLHSYMEEFFWRWFVFGNLSRIMPAGGAILLAGVGFASHHIVILSKFVPLPWAILFGAFVGVGGGVWSWLYWKHNTLWGAWVSHMLIDLGIMWIGWELIK